VRGRRHGYQKASLPLSSKRWAKIEPLSICIISDLSRAKELKQRSVGQSPYDFMIMSFELHI
jgi:hypothetical protein